MERSHYDVLEVSPKASLEAIKGAYRFLQQKWHPDKNPQARAQAERTTRELNEAYEVLSDPARRARYDEMLRARQAQAAPDPGRQPGPRQAVQPGRADFERVARAYGRAQAARPARRPRRSRSTLWVLLLAAAMVAILLALNPGLLKPARGGPALTIQPRGAAADADAQYRAELAVLRGAHPELDPASRAYDTDRARGFMARVGQYMDRGLSPSQALGAATRDTYSP